MGHRPTHPGQYGVTMATRSALDSRTVADARDGLERVLEAIREGELTAGPGYVARLEGSITALNALLSEPKRPKI